MPPSVWRANLLFWAGRIQRAVQYAFYDWTREIPRWKRALTWLGLLIQGYAIWAALTRSLVWPVMWPEGFVLLNTIWLTWAFGGLLINGMLTSELVRKTQMESDLSAARRIQDTLHPHGPLAVTGYQVESSYTPFRVVGGDYFDVVELGNGRTLFAMADVAGKGMPAALLAANVQALVRSIATTDPSPLTLATRINEHLSRYTPDDRFVTAVFAVLAHASGNVAYVNAGHNAPLLATNGAATSLEATGVPLGLFAAAPYEVRTAEIPPGGTLLFFTDGLPDSIRDDDPESRIRHVVSQSGAKLTIASVTTLVDRRLVADDITMVLVRRL